jgi:glyoxylase-like metal-dependent hydrolase (beta-lactamase superfamily II)
VTFVASVGDDGILLADTGYLEYAPDLRRRLAILGEGRPVRFVTNTHHHDDHIGANAFFSPGSIKVSSDALLEAMKTPSVFLAGVTEDFWSRHHVLGFRLDLLQRRADPAALEPGRTQLVGCNRLLRRIERALYR